MKSVELFTGAGGMALGFHKAGFEHLEFIEYNRHACATIRANGALGVKPFSKARLHETDIREHSYAEAAGKIDIATGGPPCQPFSIGGKHKAHADRRDMFPEAARCIRETIPKAFVFENVRGLTRKSFSAYFEYILLSLTYPFEKSKDDEAWEEHLARLEKLHTSGKTTAPHYNIVFRLLNAADYGVPQKRERVFIVGIRSDLGKEFSFPKPTHSRFALAREKWVTGDYWEKHGVAKRKRPPSPDSLESLLEPTLFDMCAGEKPWRTVRDAIRTLPDPKSREASKFANHVFQPGARVYKGHTGSPLDEPAKTLKAGDHGVPGGENMAVFEDGTVRYFTVRESARLQTFPDEVYFEGAWSESMRQLGNAVPVDLAYVVADQLRQTLKAK